MSCVSFTLDGCVAFSFVLEKAIGTSVPSGLDWVNMADVEEALVSTNRLNGFVKSTTYNGLVVAWHNRRFSSWKAYSWIGPKGIFAGTCFAVRSVNGFAKPAKFSICLRKYEKKPIIRLNSVFVCGAFISATILSFEGSATFFP